MVSDFSINETYIHPTFGVLKYKGRLDEVHNPTMTISYYVFYNETTNITYKILPAEIDKAYIRPIIISNQLPDVVAMLQTKYNIVDSSHLDLINDIRDNINTNNLAKCIKYYRILQDRKLVGTLTVKEQELDSTLHGMLIAEIAHILGSTVDAGAFLQAAITAAAP